MQMLLRAMTDERVAVWGQNFVRACWPRSFFHSLSGITQDINIITFLPISQLLVLVVRCIYMLIAPHDGKGVPL